MVVEEPQHGRVEVFYSLVWHKIGWQGGARTSMYEVSKVKRAGNLHTKLVISQCNAYAK